MCNFCFPKVNICLKLIRPRPGGLCASCSYSYAPIVFSQLCGNARLVLTLLLLKPCAARVYDKSLSPRIHGPWQPLRAV